MTGWWDGRPHPGDEWRGAVAQKKKGRKKGEEEGMRRPLPKGGGHCRRDAAAAVC